MAGGAFESGLDVGAVAHVKGIGIVDGGRVGGGGEGGEAEGERGDESESKRGKEANDSRRA
jgi:hypothetical protein